MSLLIVAALSGVLSSPVAPQGIPEPEYTEEKMWDGLRQSCDEDDPAEPTTDKDRAKCYRMVRELKALSTQPSKGMAKRFMRLANQHGGFCTDKAQKEYALSRLECLKYIARKTPACERVYLSKPITGAFNLILFGYCIQPDRSCNKFTTSDDKAWKEHCNELAWDGNG